MYRFYSKSPTVSCSSLEVFGKVWEECRYIWFIKNLVTGVSARV